MSITSPSSKSGVGQNTPQCEDTGSNPVGATICVGGCPPTNECICEDLFHMHEAYSKQEFD